MSLNRRTFFQTAVLSGFTVIQGKGATPPLLEQSTTDTKAPVEVDLAEPGSAKYVGRSATDLFVRLEELQPLDPGELSGAELRITDSGHYLTLSAAIGDVLQRNGCRTSHLLGCMNAEDAKCLLDEYERSGGSTDFGVSFDDLCSPERSYSVWATLVPGDSPELHLDAGRHCLGVLRGELLVKFFDGLRKRTEQDQTEKF